MEISITFKDGPIDAEITADEEDNYEEVLRALSDFVEEYQPAGVVEGKETQAESEEQVTIDEVVQTDSDEDEGETQSSERISNLQELPDDKLYRLVKVGQVEDGDISEHPRIIGDTSTLGDADNRKLLNSSIIILTVLDDIHGVDRMKTSELKQALADSGLNDDSFSNIDKLDEADVYLNRRGRGSTATTEIRPPGKDEAYNLISRITSET